MKSVATPPCSHRTTSDSDEGLSLYEEVVTTAIERHDKRELSTRERLLDATRDIEPFNAEKQPDRYRADIFDSDEELEAFIEDIYAERRKHLA
jgi:hypothetical protein